MQLLKTFPSLAFGAAVVATPALAEFRFDGANGSAVLFYGQVNPAFASVDDGTERNGNFADNAASNTRVGLLFTQPYDDMTFTFRFETGLGLTTTSQFDQTGSIGVSGWRRTDLRHVDFALKGNWGKFSAGQGSMAADGAAEISNAQVRAILYQFTGDANSLYQFRTAGGALSGVRVGATIGTFDGSRRGRIRYDTPEFGGFSVGVSYGKNILATQAPDNTFSDIALRYENEFANGMLVRGAVAYQNLDRPNAENTTSVVASGAVLFQNGISFAAGYGSQDDKRAGRSDPDWAYGQIAYDRDYFGIGITSVGVDYYKGSDFNTVGSSSESWGIGILQQVDNLNTEFYAMYRMHKFDEVAASYQDMNTYVIGARVKF